MGDIISKLIHYRLAYNSTVTAVFAFWHAWEIEDLLQHITFLTHMQVSIRCFSYNVHVSHIKSKLKWLTVF